MGKVCNRRCIVDLREDKSVAASIGLNNMQESYVFASTGGDDSPKPSLLYVVIAQPEGSTDRDRDKAFLDAFEKAMNSGDFAALDAELGGQILSDVQGRFPTDERFASTDSFTKTVPKGCCFCNSNINIMLLNPDGRVKITGPRYLWCDNENHDRHEEFKTAIASTNEHILDDCIS